MRDAIQAEKLTKSFDPFQGKQGVQITFENTVNGILEKLSETYPELEFSSSKNGSPAILEAKR